jgi:hypothetical protein
MRGEVVGSFLHFKLEEVMRQDAVFAHARASLLDQRRLAGNHISRAVTHFLRNTCYVLLWSGVALCGGIDVLD